VKEGLVDQGFHRDSIGSPKISSAQWRKVNDP
jgi:hypothetical protein